MNIIKHNFETFSKYKKKFNKYELENNLYIDGNHLLIFLNELIDITEKIYNEILSEYIDEKLILHRNQTVYSQLIFKIITKIEDLVETKIVEDNPEIEFLRDLHYPIFTDKKLNIENENEILNEINNYGTSRSLKPVNNPTHYFEKNSYIKFFIGGSPDFDKLIRLLKIEKRRMTRDFNYKSGKRISEFIDYFSNLDQNKKSNDEYVESIKSRDLKFEEYKKAIDNFDKSYKNIIAENHKGDVRFDFINNHNFFIKFQEKGVDTKLTMEVMDDLCKLKNTSCFSIVTNDSDFSPLFNKVRKDNKLLWFYGAPEKRKSNALVINSQTENNYGLYNLLFYGSSSYFTLPQTSYWDYNQILPLLKEKDEKQRYLLWEHIKEMFEHQVSLDNYYDEYYDDYE